MVELRVQQKWGKKKNKENQSKRDILMLVLSFFLLIALKTRLLQENIFRGNKHFL